MAKVTPYSNRGQGVILVLYALSQLGAACTKQEVLDFISDTGFYDITRHDLPAYPSQNESRYRTLLAWARKDALINSWLEDPNERDAWQLSREGRRVLERTIERYKSGEWSVRKCYLWTPHFKKLIDPAYEPSPEDSVRAEERFAGLLA